MTQAHEARISALEQIVIVILNGGWRPPGINPPGDSFASDTTRMEALLRRPPKGDPFASDVTRLSAEVAESSLLAVTAEITRLRSIEGELHARLKQLRTGPAAG